MIGTMKEMTRFSVWTKEEEDYMYELGKYEIVSEEADIHKQFDSKGELIAFIIDNLI